MAKIIRQDQINESTYVLWLEEESVPKPGQFYMVYPKDGSKLLGRPISVFDYREGHLGLLYEVVGGGTEEFSKLEAGEDLRILGPYGRGFTPYPDKKVACIAGGVGLAPFIYLSRFLKGTTRVYFGTRNGQGFADYLKDYPLDLKIQEGGYITDAVDFQAYDQFYTCGPRVMMNVVLDRCRQEGKDLELSLEERMGCGFGACLACTCQGKEGRKKVCLDGPVFAKEELDHA